MEIENLGAQILLIQACSLKDMDLRHDLSGSGNFSQCITAEQKRRL